MQCKSLLPQKKKREDGLLYGRPVRLVTFLKALTGVEDEKDLNLGSIHSDHKQDLLDHGMIFWNHFSLIRYSPTSADLMKFMYRSMAAQCKPNQPGLDQIFTIYLKRDSDGSDLKENNISFCGVQAKNRPPETNMDALIQDSNHKYTDLSAGVKIQETNPYLILFMNLNTTETRISTLPPLRTRVTRNSSSSTDDRRASLVFHGLDKIACLNNNKELIDALKELINTEPEVIKLKSKESGKLFSKIINPCQYQD